MLDEVATLTIAIAGAGGDIPIAAHVHVSRNVNTTRLQQIVHLPPIHEGPLHLQIVQNEGTAQLDVLLGLGQGITTRIEGNENVHDGPISDGALLDDIISEEDALEQRFVQPRQDLPHWLGPRLLIHGADADADAISGADPVGDVGGIAGGHGVDRLGRAVRRLLGVVVVTGRGRGFGCGGGCKWGWGRHRRGRAAVTSVGMLLGHLPGEGRCRCRCWRHRGRRGRHLANPPLKLRLGREVDRIGNLVGGRRSRHRRRRRILSRLLSLVERGKGSFLDETILRKQKEPTKTRMPRWISPPARAAFRPFAASALRTFSSWPRAWP
mmetsp:Transcript_14162/g.40627  ORF Transcript_14162/g.40627 Transcript_14162/m.40627 type:complete len:324 (+) Transcript_14162:3512-4483(+)